MPAMVGAICGAIHGCEPLPQRWLSKVSVTRGLCIPSLAGVDLTDLADRLIAAREAARQLQSSGHP
jgi:hypothetical protein